MIPNDAHARGRLLIIAADARIRDMCAKIAEDLGMVIYSTCYTDDLLEIARTLRPTWLILDLKLPSQEQLSDFRTCVEEGIRPGIVLLSDESPQYSWAIANLLSDHGLDVIKLLKQPVSPDQLTDLLSALHRKRS